MLPKQLKDSQRHQRQPKQVELFLQRSANVEDSLTNLSDFPFINAHVKPRQLRRRGMHNMGESWLKGSRRNMVCANILILVIFHGSAIDTAVAAKMLPHWVWAWEDPKLEGNHQQNLLWQSLVSCEPYIYVNLGIASFCQWLIASCNKSAMFSWKWHTYIYLSVILMSFTSQLHSRTSNNGHPCYQWHIHQVSLKQWPWCQGQNFWELSGTYLQAHFNPWDYRTLAPFPVSHRFWICSTCPWCCAHCKGNCKLDLAKLAGGPKSILFK